MCGITGGIAQRDVAPILIEGLKRLEYRGYDSAGLAVVRDSKINRVRVCGKVKELADKVISNPLLGRLGIAHTRWATHGKPHELNAHPMMSSDNIAVVHNGIIENHETLRDELKSNGYVFESQTDTEVVAHLIHQYYKIKPDLFDAVQKAFSRLHGAFALAVICKDDLNHLVVARMGCPLVIGVGIGEHFVASDSLALLPVTKAFLTLEDGDVAKISCDAYTIVNNGTPVTRDVKEVLISLESAEKGNYRHFMLKEIFEQPIALRACLEGRISETGTILDEIFGAKASSILGKTKAVQIIACGTSYHAGLIAKHWIEGLCGLPCHVEVASEFRSRKVTVLEGTLMVTISQSGETADSYAALCALTSPNYCGKLAICNVAESSIVKASDLVLLTNAGPEIGVASTKAFTTQLASLLMLSIALGQKNGLASNESQALVSALKKLPLLVEQTLEIDAQVKKIAQNFIQKSHALFLGRGIMYPIAAEGALKLKEISYIHAEAYPAGELKHGPLALVDEDMPVVALVANDELLPKMCSNIQEVQARGGQIYAFVEKGAAVTPNEKLFCIELPKSEISIAPIIQTIAMQLLAYHVAVLKGTDVDQPRNLAKSVTVE